MFGCRENGGKPVETLHSGMKSCLTILIIRIKIAVFCCTELELGFKHIDRCILTFGLISEYTDENIQIPRGSSVIIKRVPAGSVHADV